MVKTTRKQREALFKVFQREFPHWISPTQRVERPYQHPQDRGKTVKVPSIQYRRFRAKVQPFFGGDCIMVPYAGMWLGIERDGYTHS